MVSARFQLLVFTADFAAAADDPAGKWQDHIGDIPRGRRPSLSRRQCQRRRCPENQEVAAGDALGRAELIFAEEFAVHHWQPPEAAIIEFFRGLKAVAEITKLPAHAKGLAFNF